MTLITHETHTTSPFVTQNRNSNKALGQEHGLSRRQKLQSFTSSICLGTTSLSVSLSRDRDRPALATLSFIYLPLPPSADVNTHDNRHNQDYQQDQRHDDSDAPWETDRGQMVWRDDEEGLKGGGGGFR